MSKYLTLMITSEPIILCVTNGMHHLAIGKVYNRGNRRNKIWYFKKKKKFNFSAKKKCYILLFTLKFQFNIFCIPKFILDINLNASQ